MKGARVGQPVVHFEIVGKDAAGLQKYYSELFGWQIPEGHTIGVVKSA